uniref:Choline/carnitine acyltransferase domain-containing protein n=1 Tax=Ditylenchus dipsaci TaxID=166011 RepID=A0A915EEN2_9BILA
MWKWRLVDSFRSLKTSDPAQSMAESQDNWINIFWLAEMYLKQRYALPVNSNPAYIFPRQHFENEEDQIE